MARAGDLDEALVLAPLRNDAAVLTSLLETSGIAARVCAGPDELGKCLERSRPGALVVTQEALTEPVIALVAGHLDAQPQWSEVPVVVLVEASAVRSSLPALLAEKWQRSRQVFYRRPVSRLELLSGIQSALLARIRQRDVRDHLDLERELRHELNHRVKNILASVNSIFRMTVRNSDSLEALDGNFTGRLETLGRVHSALFESGGERIDLDTLVSLVLAPYANRGDAGFRAEGPISASTRTRPPASASSSTSSSPTRSSTARGRWPAAGSAWSGRQARKVSS